MALGENIKSRREELKLSQEYIAEQLGVSRQAIAKWEGGQSSPNSENLIKLANLLSVPIDELLFSLPEEMTRCKASSVCSTWNHRYL